MSNPIGTEEAPKIIAGLEDLMNEVKTRTNSTITGIPIPAITVTDAITKDDLIIVEQANGTKSAKVQAFLTMLGELEELVNARPDLAGVVHANLKSRLDQMEQVGLSNKAILDGIVATVEELYIEIEKARGTDKQGAQYSSLGDRLDAMQKEINLLNGTGIVDPNELIKELSTVVERLKEVVEENQGRIDDLERTATGLHDRVTALENGSNDVADIKRRLDAIEPKVTKNEQDIQELKNITLRFRTI